MSSLGQSTSTGQNQTSSAGGQAYSDQGERASQGDGEFDSRVEKRVKLGLSPRRPTAKAAPLRPPDSNNPPITPVVLTSLLAVIITATVLLVAASLTDTFPAWLPVRAPWSRPANMPVLQANGQSPVYQLRISDNFDEPTSTLAQGERPDEWRITLVPTEAVYRMEIWPNRIAWSLLGTSGLANHRLQTNTVVASHTPFGYVGLVERYGDERNFYLFTVDGEGRYQVQMQREGVLSTLQSWTESEFLHPAGSGNLLAVEDNGQILRFFGNDMLLYEVDSPQLPMGDVGLVGGSLGPSVAEVRFDWLQLFDVLAPGGQARAAP